MNNIGNIAHYIPQLVADGLLEIVELEYGILRLRTTRKGLSRAATIAREQGHIVLSEILERRASLLELEEGEKKERSNHSSHAA